MNESADGVDRYLARLDGADEPPQIILVHGDLVLAESAGRRIAERLAQRAGLAASEVSHLMRNGSFRSCTPATVGNFCDGRKTLQGSPPVCICQ